jgi:DNA-binding response OmpR family regulator
MRAGIEILRGRACAVAFIDWRLGGEDGLEIVRLASGEGIPTRLVLMTGYPDAECSAEVVRLGAVYLIKPVAMDVLAAIARGAIARHRFSEAVSPSGIFAGPPHARLAEAIVAVVDAPRDVLTIDAWGNCPDRRAAQLRAGASQLG